MSEEEIMQGINKTISFMKEELKADHSCFTIQELWAVNGLLDLYQKEKEKNKQLEKIIRIIRNKLKYKVIIEENGFYKPCKNLSKQEVYKDYEEIIDLLKADYCFMDNETAIKEILKENGVN